MRLGKDQLVDGPSLEPRERKVLSPRSECRACHCSGSVEVGHGHFEECEECESEVVQ